MSTFLVSFKIGFNAVTKPTFTLHVNEVLEIERISYLVYTDHRLYFPFVVFQLDHVHVLSVYQCTLLMGHRVEQIRTSAVSEVS